MEGLEAALQSATREELVAEIVKLTALNSEHSERIVEQSERIERLEALVVELQRRLNKPPKNPGNSSVPPSRGEKENKKTGGNKRRKKRGFGAWRWISKNPDEILDLRIDSCPHCSTDLRGQPQQLRCVREKTEVIIKTHVTHARLHGCECPHCGRRVRAEASEGFEGGSPFGRSVDALVVLLHYTQSVSYSRLKELMSQVFSLEISQGAIRNIIKRSQGRLEERGEEIMEAVRGSPVICSDETGSRVEGSKLW